MEIRTMAQFAASEERPEYLFWVGCAGSFDPRAQKVTRTFAQLLQDAGISFAILGNEETCTGDPARRAGNEFLFQMLAIQNIQVLNSYAVHKIVTTCPHCFNVLKNDYPDLGGQYEVIHHSQLLEELLSQGRLKLKNEVSTEKLTFHDSCFLGRANGIYQAPRSVLQFLKMEIVEMERNRENGLCCGAGGAQMFKEDEPGEKRINVARSEEALKSGATTVAVNCPFCLTMLSDGMKALNKADDLMVYDLSELIMQKKQT